MTVASKVVGVLVGMASVQAFLPPMAPLTPSFTGSRLTSTMASPATYKRADITMMSVATPADLARAANEARGLAMDSIAAAHSGHLGLPLGAAEVGAVLWGKGMQYNPEDPQWINRDRFVLSAGHGSMFLYSWLHMSGYALPLDEVKRFRQHHSMTPGHPEFPNSEHNTPGIECTTGPLGQGVANAAGMAAAQKHAAAMFNTPQHTIFDNHIIALAGDGCFQEGVSAESAAFAAHEGLDNLIVLYDSNDVTLDAMAERTQSEDIAARYKAYGWEVVQINGHDIAAIDKAVTDAKANDNGKPKFIICKTIIGKGIDEVAGTNAGHGEAGVKYVDASRKKLGLPEEKWYVSPETKAFFAKRKDELKSKYTAWQSTYKDWQAANPEKAKILDDAIHKKTPDAKTLLSLIPEFDASKSIATREAGAIVLQPLAKALPMYLSGSADLHSSNKNYIKGVGDFGRGKDKSYLGRNVLYGIREHGMGAILNGFGNFGLHRVSGSTFLVFVDYMRAPIRVAALSELPIGYILTHDSIGVGEDGPTHQPVETVSGLRVFPNLDVMRPADPEETAGAYVHSIVRKTGPTALILTRQNVKVLPGTAQSKREGVMKGAYIIRKETAPLELILLAAGSEVQHAVAAAEKIGPGVRVISVPCMSLFDRQSESYKEELLPKNFRKRIAMEAGVSGLWYKYVGLDGKVVSVDRFGFSAPGDIVMKELGMTADNLEKVARDYMAAHK